jgi:hypothetical protein
LHILQVSWKQDLVKVLRFAALDVGLHPSLDDQCRWKDVLVKGARRVHHHTLEPRGVGEQLWDRLKPSNQ